MASTKVGNAADKQKDSRRSKIFSRMKQVFSRYFVVKNALALSFLVASFTVLLPLLRQRNDWINLGLVLYGVLIIILCLALISEFVVKTVRLQLEPTRRYSAIVSINAFFGLLLPLMFSNFVLSYAMRALNFMTHNGTFFCELRTTLVRFYYQNGVYWQINSLVITVITLIVALFLFGPLFERPHRRE